MIISRQQVLSALKAYAMQPPATPGAGGPAPVTPNGSVRPPAAGGPSAEAPVRGVGGSEGGGKDEPSVSSLRRRDASAGAATPSVHGPAGSSGAAAVGGPQGPGRPPRDRVDLSPAAATVQRLVAEARALPDVRHERVEALRQRIARGAYQVSPEQVAERMLRRLLVDRAQEGR